MAERGFLKRRLFMDQFLEERAIRRVSVHFRTLLALVIWKGKLKEISCLFPALHSLGLSAVKLNST